MLLLSLKWSLFAWMFLQQHKTFSVRNAFHIAVTILITIYAKIITIYCMTKFLINNKNKNYIIVYLIIHRAGR